MHCLNQDDLAYEAAGHCQNSSENDALSRQNEITILFKTNCIKLKSEGRTYDSKLTLLLLATFKCENSNFPAVPRPRVVQTKVDYRCTR